MARQWEHDALVGAYSHLPNEPRSPDALHMLRKISSLVKPIMRKRGWRVGTLTEFFPAQTNLLGLNVDRGHKICLRLRYPGDRSQFMPLENVVDTMLHELSHNVFGPHDEKFHALWEELRDEYTDLKIKGYTGEGFLSDGRRLGGGMIPMQEMRRRARAEAEHRRGLQQSAGHKVGGRAVLRGSDIRQVIADAASRRTKNTRITQGCASGRQDSGSIAEEASHNGFRTKAEEDAANAQAINDALWELVQEEEAQAAGLDPQVWRTEGLIWNPTNGLQLPTGFEQPIDTRTPSRSPAPAPSIPPNKPNHISAIARKPAPPLRRPTLTSAEAANANNASTQPFTLQTSRAANALANQRNSPPPHLARLVTQPSSSATSSEPARRSTGLKRTHTVRSRANTATSRNGDPSGPVISPVSTRPSRGNSNGDRDRSIGSPSSYAPTPVTSSSTQFQSPTRMRNVPPIMIPSRPQTDRITAMATLREPLTPSSNAPMPLTRPNITPGNSTTVNSTVGTSEPDSPVMDLSSYDDEFISPTARAGPGLQRSASSSLVTRSWQCPMCTLCNPMSFLCCDACNAQRPSSEVRDAVDLDAELAALQAHEQAEAALISNNITRTYPPTYLHGVGNTAPGYIYNQPSTFGSGTTQDGTHFGRASADDSHYTQSNNLLLGERGVMGTAAAKRDDSKLGWNCTTCASFMEKQWWTCSACGKMRESWQ